ncbi:invasion associated locus B family protein [Hyphococcus flavus]|uniref:Invasion associated locus B family protein n=1 Tax=Hyphococcus flavus TaxID=1866326 RepID=A0AAF0CB57_9PROT|nr:invasion associated locus B family protein [Hyphococcus flavus]WDI30025.1 invasion associated locus B family protein [Hyphococcus flavus]
MSRSTLPVVLAAISGLAVTGLSVTGAVAQQPEAKATFRDWSVFVREVDGEKICFAATEATDKSPKSVNHGDIFFLIATWASGAASEQPSLMTGYALNAKPEPTLRIGSDKWDMYVSENEAFIEESAEEDRLVRAMRRGADMRISALSQRGTATSYVISLRGVSAALDRAKAECQ